MTFSVDWRPSELNHQSFMADIPKASVYTKKGDQGTTSLVGGSRVPKFHERVKAYGDVDELNSVLGVLKNTVLTYPEISTIDPTLFLIQNHLFNVGSLLACEDEKLLTQLPQVGPNHIEWLEKQIDLLNHPLPLLREFILPGGHPAAAWSHMARTVCRRAERQVTEIQQKQNSFDNSLIYLNRLSDFFFILARWIHFKTQTPEVKWNPQA